LFLKSTVTVEVARLIEMKSRLNAELIHLLLIT
jgi:hypothetical protein